MGNGSDDDSLFKRQTHQKSQMLHKLKILMLIVLSNLVTFYFVKGPSTIFQNPISSSSQLPLSAYDSTTLFVNLNETREELESSRSEIVELQMKLKATGALVKKLIAQLSRLANDQSSEPINLKYTDLLTGMSEEVKLAIGPHKLPLGHNPQFGSDEVSLSVGGGCLKDKESLQKYMSYNVGGDCPADDVFAQGLMLKGCEPLPRRRCHPKSPANYVEPAPFPESLWSTPADSSIVWDPYTCKNYDCLIERRNKPGTYDCKDCFHLQGREKTRWLNDNGGLDFGIDQVLETKPHGTIRIGLDIGGGSGSFAARMKERNVTIVTTSMNFDGPFNSFIASRGLISMHVSISQRFPFFENTLDIVHSMHVLSNWIPDAMLEFTLYDIYRVLRPGGLFWLDRFFCFGSQLNETYVPMFDRIGFNKLRWYSGMKFDRGIEKNEWYFSALLEKPMT